LPKLFFPEGIGGVQKSRNSVGVREEGGWWCYFRDQNMEIPESRGVYVKFPPSGVRIFSGKHTF